MSRISGVITGLVLVASLAIISSCGSSLTNVATNVLVRDPKDVKAVVTFNYVERESTTTVSDLSFSFKDNNNSYVRLLEGYIKINDIALEYQGPFYESGSIVVDPNSYIRFEIRLADTNRYYDSSLTPRYDAVQLDSIPDSAGISDTIRISTLGTLSQSNIASITIGGVSAPFKLVTAQNKILILPLKNAALRGTAAKLVILFYTTKTILPQFMAGSFIEFRFSYEKSVRFY